jgi:uncharacterized membrane protein
MNNKEAGRFQSLLILLVIGFSLFFTGVIVLTAAVVLSGGSANFGAIIFIGPFPVVVRVGPEVTWAVLFAVVLAVLSGLMFLMLRRELGKEAT